MTKAKSKDLQQKIMKNTTTRVAPKGVKLTTSPTVLKKSNVTAFHVEASKNKNILFHVHAPNSVNKEELANTIKAAIDSGGVLVTGQDVIIHTISLK